MKDNDDDGSFELSRRRALAALGTVGIASAGAGVGTSAYFSDTETFADNTLTAGELDLKVDWEEHYSDWSPDEDTDRTDDEGGDETEEGNEFDVRMTAPPDDQSGAFRPFPPGASDPLIWVPTQFVDDFMDNTSIEAYPDANNDGIAEFPIEEMNGRAPCDFLADVGDDDDGLDPDSDPLGRTDTDDTRLEDGSPAPLIDLQDVKPGDFGEITFSTHLCDNPGYLWLNMPGGLTASENGLTEPEADDPDEEEGTVELVEAIQTAIWYDNNCDNLVTCPDRIDLMAVADTSGSIEGELGNGTTDEEVDLIREGANTFVDELRANTDPGQVQAGLLTFNGAGDAGEQSPGGAQAVFDRPALRAGLGPLDQFDRDGDGDSEIGQFLPSEGNGDTPTPHALDLAQQVLEDQGRPGARKVILLVADGLPDYPGDVEYTVTDAEGGPLTGSGDTYTSDPYDGTGEGDSSATEQDETARIAAEIQNAGTEIFVAGISLDQTSTNGDSFLRDEVAGDDGNTGVAQPSFFFDAEFSPGASNDINTISTRLAQTLVTGQSTDCDEVFFTGSLGEAEAVLTGNDGRGVPLDGQRMTGGEFDELSDPEDDPGRDCFLAATTACFGFAWWLPVDHANEIQTDSVSFDLGFYTEQCRHNDGGGRSPIPDA